MGWSEEFPVTVKLRSEWQGVNHEAPGNRGSQSEGIGIRKSQEQGSMAGSQRDGDSRRR